MRKALSLLLISLMPLLLIVSSPALAALTEVGPAITPHGYPQYYQDANGLRLQLCQDGDGASGFCVFAPVDPALTESMTLGVGSQTYWWAASALINDRTADIADPQELNAEIFLALEGAFTGSGAPSDGSQIAIGRIQIRIDAPVAGNYTVTHPYGVEVFENVPAGPNAIDASFDLGAINVLDPAAAFSGALRAKIGPFLTWPDYLSDRSLKVPHLDADGLPTGEFSQYIGNPQIPGKVIGSPFIEAGAAEPANYFRIRGPNGIDVRTELFSVMGKVLPEPAPVADLHVFPPAPAPNLFAVGPVNRAVPFSESTTGTVTGTEGADYPVGFPLWYQEKIATAGPSIGGLRLTLCPPADQDAMCVSPLIDPHDPEARRLRIGEKAFWWSAQAAINGQTPDMTSDLPPGLDARLNLSLEAGFGGDGTVRDGDQIAVGRVAIHADVPADGTYTVTHPYGTEVIENVTTAEGIDFSRSLGVVDPADPDGSFIGALYSSIGPRFLTWPDYQQQQSLQDNGSQYVGDPAVPHVVTGSTFIPEGEDQPANYFRIRGPNGIDVTTYLFSVSGKVFPVETPRVAALSLLDSDVVPSVSLNALTTVVNIGDDIIGTFRNGAWYFDNGNGAWDAGVDTVFPSFGGVPSDIPFTGDWDGNGIKQIGVFRDGAWYLDANDNGAWDPGIDTVYASFGMAGDRPVIGDWDGDGIDQIGVFRNGAWYLDANGNGAWDPGTDTVYSSFGYPYPIDVPVTGDWDGDGSDEIGVFRNGAWYLDANGNGAWDSEIDTVYPNFGYPYPVDKPVTGDWDGDGSDEIGVFRNVNGLGAWYLDANGNGGWDTGIDLAFAAFGLASDVPLVGTLGSGRGGSQPVVTLTYQAALLPSLVNGGFSAALAINSNGLTVGLSEDAVGLKAARWTGGVPTELTPLVGFNYSAAYGVNTGGTAVGESDNGPFITASYWPIGTTDASALSTTGLTAGNSTAYAINDGGAIVGEGAGDTEGSTVAVYWAGTGFDPVTLPNLTALDGSSVAYAINADGLIVGESLNGDGEMQAVVWVPGAGGGYTTPIPLPEINPDQMASLALGIDGNGRIVGEAEETGGTLHGVVWILNAAKDGVALTQDLGVNTSAQAINGSNRIVGNSTAGNGNDQATIWNGASFADRQILTGAFSQALSINNSGQLVGISGTQALLATPE